VLEEELVLQFPAFGESAGISHQRGKWMIDAGHVCSRVRDLVAGAGEGVVKGHLSWREYLFCHSEVAAATEESPFGLIEEKRDSSTRSAPRNDKNYFLKALKPVPSGAGQ